MISREQLEELKTKADLYKQTFSAYARIPKQQPHITQRDQP